MFGRLIGSRRQARVVYSVMVTFLVLGAVTAIAAERHGSPVLRQSGVDLTATNGSAGGNLADKEVRFGAENNCERVLRERHDLGIGKRNRCPADDALTPAGGAVPL